MVLISHFLLDIEINQKKKLKAKEILLKSKNYNLNSDLKELNFLDLSNNFNTSISSNIIC